MKNYSLGNEIIEMIKCLREDFTLEIDYNTNLLNDIGIDSMELINLVLEIEERYQIEIDFDNFEYEYLECYGDFVNFIGNVIEECNE